MKPLVIPTILLRKPLGKDKIYPCEALPDSAGMDLRAMIEADIVIQPLERCLVPTGLKMAIPKGYEGQVRPRSGLALKHGITVLNSPGTIDAGYRGEIQVLLINLGQSPFVLQADIRIAQLVISTVVQTHISFTSPLPSSLRNEEGFGSTGLD